MSLFDRNKRKNSEFVTNSEKLLHNRPYNIIPPAIPSGEVYFFTTDSGVEYEVRIGKIKDSLSRVINFNVLNDEYEDNEYSMTNKGELYRVVVTVINILKMYMQHHPHVRSYEFTGEFKDKNDNGITSIRTRFFCRALKRAFPDKEIIIEKNKGVLKV
ncbi:MAG: hypothetical protein Kow0068_08950 [Marinilabiliales bacterium]